MTTEETKEILQKYYHCLDKPSLLDLLPDKTWRQIKTLANKFGLTRPKIHSFKLKKLLDDTIINSYWWGFIYSDGHLTEDGELIFQLSNLDREHLEKISKLLEKRICEAKGDMGRVIAKDSINGKKLKEKLRINHRKTYNPPEKFDFLYDKYSRLAFLIGFIDGDGSISYRQMNNKNSFQSIRIEVHGTWLSVLTKLLDSISSDFDWFKYTIKDSSKQNKNLVRVYICSHRIYNSLFNFIKKFEIPVLKRKWKENVTQRNRNPDKKN